MRIKVLPPNPSLDHLKRQAKDLLEAMRETNPAATLSDAQRAVAKEYDFRTWPDLKAEVERRRGPVEHADPAVGEGIAAAFGLGRLVRPCVVVSHDFQGPTLRLETSDGDWMAHEVFSWVDDAQVERTLPLMEAARAAGVSTPTPVPTTEGTWVAELEGHFWRVDDWVDRRLMLMKPAPAAAVRQVGALLGTLHALRLDPGETRMNPWLTQRRAPQQWEEVVTAVARANPPWSDLLAEALPAITRIVEVAKDEPPQPLVLSHTDLVGDTVRVGARGSVVIMEWDFCGPTPPVWELGYTLHAWATDHDGEVSTHRSKALMEGYLAGGGARTTLDIGMFTSAISAWLNNLASRMSSAIKSDDDDTRRRATKEVIAMLTHPITPEQLEQLLEAVG